MTQEARRLLTKVLLGCGIASSLLYAVTEISAGMRWEGYDWTARMLSDLLAVSAPTRGFIVPPMIAYNVLVLAFGAGVWLCRRNRATAVAGVLVVVYALVSMLGLMVFPLDYRVQGSGAGMHMAATFALIVLMFLFIASAAAGSGLAFRLYSMVTVLAIVAGASLAGMQIPRIEAGLPTPGLGVFERLDIYAMLAWVVAYALTLWPRDGLPHADATTDGGSRARP
jgi:hypothetical membrane protein